MELFFGVFICFCTVLLFHVLSSTVFVVCVLWTVFRGCIWFERCCFMSCLLRFLLFDVFYGVYLGGVSVFSDVVLLFVDTPMILYQ